MPQKEETNNLPNFGKFVNDNGGVIDESFNEEDSDLDVQKGSSFDSLAFRDFIASIDKGLNAELRKIVDQLVTYKQSRHHLLKLTQRTLQVRHPIFRVINLNVFKWMTDHCTIMKLAKGQTVYKQGA